MDEAVRRRCVGGSLAVLAVMTLAFGTISIRRAANVNYDFSHFYLDARYLLEHGRINTQDNLSEAAGGPHLPWYLPLVTILFAPIAALPPLPAGVVWFVLSWASFLATVRWVGRSLTSLPARDWPLTQMLPVILCGGAIFEQCQFNQLSFVVLGGVAAAFALVRRGRPLTDWLGGLLLAAVILVKLVPGVFVVWWLVRRWWRPLAAAAVGVLSLEVGLNPLVFGPGPTWQYHLRWYRNAVQGASAAAMIESGQQNDYRNQGLGVVLARLLSDHEPGTTEIGFRPGHGRRQVHHVNILHLSKRQVELTYLAASAVSAAALTWVLWKTRHHVPRPTANATRNDGDWPDRLGFALMCLAMLWFSPLVRQYYLPWCYPAIALLLARREFHARAGRSRRWIDAALAGWVASQALWLIPEMRSAGVNLWAILLLAVALAVEALRHPAERTGPLRDSDE